MLCNLSIKNGKIQTEQNKATIADDEPLLFSFENLNKNYRYKLVATLNGYTHTAVVNQQGTAEIPASFLSKAEAGTITLDLQKWNASGTVQFERLLVPPFSLCRPLQGGLELTNLVDKTRSELQALQGKYDALKNKLKSVIEALSFVGVALELSDEGE